MSSVLAHVPQLFSNTFPVHNTVSFHNIVISTILWRKDVLGTVLDIYFLIKFLLLLFFKALFSAFTGILLGSLQRCGLLSRSVLFWLINSANRDLQHLSFIGFFESNIVIIALKLLASLNSLELCVQLTFFLCKQQRFRTNYSRFVLVNFSCFTRSVNSVYS